MCFKLTNFNFHYDQVDLTRVYVNAIVWVSDY